MAAEAAKDPEVRPGWPQPLSCEQTPIGGSVRRYVVIALPDAGSRPAYETL